jgi:hypothetical protein
MKLALCVSKLHAIKTYGKLEVIVPYFLTWAIDGGE